MPSLTDEDKVIRNDVGKRIAAAIESLSAPEAEKVSYDNTESGMTADNAQDAIDELKSDIDSVELADLDDVDLTSPQDEDELHYDSSTSKWKNIAKKIYEKSASGSLVSFNDGGDNIPLKSLIANITAVQAGSGTPSPSNVRAISGWNECKVNRTGINIWDEQWEEGAYSTYSNTGNGAKISASGYTRCKNLIPIKPNTSYYFKKPQGHTEGGGRIGYYDKDGTYLGYEYTIDSGINGSDGRLFTSPNNAFYLSIYKENAISGGSINYPSTDTSYHAYTGAQITLPFGQTVYGGTLDVLNGVLTVTKDIVDLGTLAWRYDSTYGFFYYLGNSTAAIHIKSNGAFVCSEYAYGGYKADADMASASNGVYSHGGYIYIKDTSYTDEITFKTAMNGVQLVYELATPVTYKLTPAQVSTLLGLNNIFADTGDISLSYFTQNANAINDVAESNTRTALNTDVPKTDLTDIFVTGAKNNTGSTITAGTYFYANGQLALCKQAISANADLTLNTNYELVTAGALNKIKWETGTITFIEGVTDNGSTLKKCNGVVYLHIDCYVTTAISSRTHLLSLPQGFRPIAPYTRFIIGGSSSHGSAFNRITTAFIQATGSFNLGDVIEPSGTSIIEITADISYPC